MSEITLLARRQGKQHVLDMADAVRWQTMAPRLVHACAAAKQDLAKLGAVSEETAIDIDEALHAVRKSCGPSSVHLIGAAESLLKALRKIAHDKALTAADMSALALGVLTTNELV